LSEEETAVALERLFAVTEASYERRAQLQHALESRVVIEQAKGIIAERYGLGVDEAFAAIRQASRSNRVKLRDLAASIRPGEPTPPELAAVLDV
jgi:AmiR/NasT family two-component response regulator